MEGNDRPIKFNPTGKYNLDFIDWQGEYDNICDFNSDDDDSDLPPDQRTYTIIFPSKILKILLIGESPIPGMSRETFDRLMVKSYFTGFPLFKCLFSKKKMNRWRKRNSAMMG